MNFYDIGTVNPLSCGCVEIVRNNGYDHYIHPKCSLDKGKQTMIDGYEYKAWDRLPKHLQEQYEHNIFTREF